MEHPTYKTRTHEFLLNKTRKLQNLLQLRDWEITLLTGDTISDSTNEYQLGEISYNLSFLQATIRIDITKCRESNVDPLHILYHEFGHLLYSYCTYEERFCNIFADVLYKTK